MANDIAGFKNDIKASIQARFDAATQTKIGNRWLTRYALQWNDYLTGGGTDTVANRRAFVADRIFDELNRAYRDESARENLNALPAPEVLQ